MRILQNDCPNTFSKEHDFHISNLITLNKQIFLCVYCGQKRTVLDDGEIIILRESKKIDDETKRGTN